MRHSRTWWTPWPLLLACHLIGCSLSPVYTATETPRKAQHHTSGHYPAPRILTPADYRTLERIHFYLQRHFVWTSDQEIYGVRDYWEAWRDLPVWDYPNPPPEPLRADCDGFTAMFRRLAAEQGIPTRAAILPGHMVAVAGDMVYDNTADWPRPRWSYGDRIYIVSGHTSARRWAAVGYENE